MVTIGDIFLEATAILCRTIIIIEIVKFFIDISTERKKKKEREIRGKCRSQVIR